MQANKLRKVKLVLSVHALDGSDDYDALGLEPITVAGYLSVQEILEHYKEIIERSEW